MRLLRAALPAGAPGAASRLLLADYADVSTSSSTSSGDDALRHFLATKAANDALILAALATFITLVQARGPRGAHAHAHSSQPTLAHPPSFSSSLPWA